MQKEMPKMYSPAWFGEMALLCTVFAITGSSTMFLVRPFMQKTLKLEGNAQIEM